MANERRCVLAYRQPPSRLHRRRIVSRADFYRLRDDIGGWQNICRHPDSLAMVIAGILSADLMHKLTDDDAEDLAKRVIGLRVRRGHPLRHCVNFAFLANALARRVCKFPGNHRGLLEELYLAKARWVEQAVLRAREDRDTRLSFREDGSPGVLVFDFTDLLSGRGEAVTLGFHMPVWQIRRDTPQLAAILFGS